MLTQYAMPTRVIAGKDCVRQSAAEFAKIGTKALVVTGAHSAKACGALDDVTAALNQADCNYEIYDKVTQNPTVACAFEGAGKANRMGADFVVAIGGGSPMDAAKAMALIAQNPSLTPETLFCGRYHGGALPVVAVPTTAGTGSEVTKASILTNYLAKTKSSIASPLLFPKLAFLDGRYTEKLSLRTTINTVIDALTHAAEGLLSNKSDFVSDCLAKEALTRIGGCLPALLCGRVSAEQRQSLLAASTLAGMVIANTGTTAVHGMGYSLTYFKQIPHGRANGLVFPAFLSFVREEAPERVDLVLAPLGCKTVEELKNLFDVLLGAPEPLTVAEAEQFAAAAAASANMDNCLVKPTQVQLLQIYRESFAV